MNRKLQNGKKLFLHMAAGVLVLLLCCMAGTTETKAASGNIFHDPTCECRSGERQTVLPGSVHKYYVYIQDDNGKRVDDSEFSVNWHYASFLNMAEVVKTEGATAWMKLKEEGEYGAFTIFVEYDGFLGGHKDTEPGGAYLSESYNLSSDFYTVIESPYFILCPGESKQLTLTARHYTQEHPYGEDVDITQYARWRATNKKCFTASADGTVTAVKSGTDTVPLNRDKVAECLPEEWNVLTMSGIIEARVVVVQSSEILTDGAKVTLLGSEEETGYVYFKPSLAAKYRLYGSDPDNYNDEYQPQVLELDTNGDSKYNGVIGALTPGKVYLLSIPHRVCSKDEVITILPEHEHECGEGVITEEPTVTDRGMKRYFCIHCGHLVKKEWIPRLEGEEENNSGNSGGGQNTSLWDSMREGSKILEVEDACYDIVPSGSGAVLSYRLCKQKGASVTVPDFVWIGSENIPVTGISAGAFKNNKKIRKIQIGNQVTSIGKNAFSGCAKLTSVAGGKNITSIGNSAFAGCTALKKFTIGKKVADIGKKAFANCKKLKTFTIKTTKLTKKNIGKNAFSGMPSNVSVKVPGKKVKAYKSLLKSKGLSKKAKIK